MTKPLCLGSWLNAFQNIPNVLAFLGFADLKFSGNVPYKIRARSIDPSQGQVPEGLIYRQNLINDALSFHLTRLTSNMSILPFNLQTLTTFLRMGVFLFFFFFFASELVEAKSYYRRR